jgi:hypothetical protein
MADAAGRGTGQGERTRLPARFPPAPGFTNKTTCTETERTAAHCAVTRHVDQQSQWSVCTVCADTLCADRRMVRAQPITHVGLSALGHALSAMFGLPGGCPPPISPPPPVACRQEQPLQHSWAAPAAQQLPLEECALSGGEHLHE